MKSTLAFLLFGLLIGICGVIVQGCKADADEADDDNDNGDDDDPLPDGGVELHGPCDALARVGDFELSVGSEESQPLIDGEVREAVVPFIPPSVVMEDGSCKLYKKNIPECDPECDIGLICDAEGNCVPYPLIRSVGTVTVDGLNVPVAMEPFSETNPIYFDTSLSYPVLEVNALIRLSATGGEYSEFSLYGRGIEVLQCLNDTWPVAKGQGITIDWTPGTVADATVTATMSIDQHGTTPASIVCTGADTGSFEVSSELIDELISMGISGFPSGMLVRRTVDSVAADLGCIEFIVISSVSVEVVVAEN